MNRLKTLIKVEFKTTILMVIYFISIGVISCMGINRILQKEIENELMTGIGEGICNGYFGYDWSLAFRENMQFYMLLFIVGISVLIYLSYKNDKNHQVGRFLKSLPYTVQERYFIKTAIGVVIFTIPYILYGIGLFALRNNFLTQAKDIYEVTIFSEMYQEFLSSGQLLSILAIGYMELMVCYLFGIMFEYIISFNLASIIIATLVGISPLFVLWNLRFYIKGENRILEDIGEFYSDLIFCTGSGGEITIEGPGIFHKYTGCNAMDLIWVRVGIFLLMALICIGITLVLCKTYYLENTDILMPSKIFRVIFVIGVTVCAGMLLGDFYYMYTRNGSNIMYLFNIIGSSIGLPIAWRIACIGIKQRNGSKLDRLKKAKEVM